MSDKETDNPYQPPTMSNEPHAKQETAKPKARLRMGSIKGATIMAPITTAVLLEISPRVAITAELIRRMKNQGMAWMR